MSRRRASIDEPLRCVVEDDVAAGPAAPEASTGEPCAEDDEELYEDAEEERGFTLLEVMVALAILAVSMTALLGTQGSSVRLTRYVNGVTIASLLARGKMLDLEYKLKEDGFDAFSDDVETGDFSEEGHRDFRWEAHIEKIELDEGAVESMLESAPQSREDVLTRLNDNPQIQGMDLSSLNFNPAMIFNFVPTAIEILGEKVRKVSLTIRWKDGRQDRSLLVQTFFVQHEEFTEKGPEGELPEDEEPTTPPSKGRK